MSFIIYAFVPRQREVPARIRGRANGAFRTIVLISNSFSAPFLSFVVLAASSSAAFAVAGASALLAVAGTYFTPLRRYNLNEPTPDERGAAHQSAIGPRGGISGIAMSHPHFYGAMVEWSRAFGGAPIHIPAADRSWVQYDDPAIVTWEGTREVLPGVTLIQCGGHFEGSAVLHWAEAAEGRGALLVGDTITVVPDIRFVSFMRSYPNLIPLPANEIRRIVERVRPYRFDRIYGGWWDRVMPAGGIKAIERSASRYLRWIGADARG